MNNQKYQDPFVAVVVRLLLASPSFQQMADYWVYFFANRLIQIAPSPLVKSILAPSVRSQKDTRLPTPPHLNIKPSRSKRSKTLVSMLISTINSKWRYSRVAWIRSCWDYCGTNIGLTPYLKVPSSRCVIHTCSFIPLLTVAIESSVCGFAVERFTSKAGKGAVQCCVYARHGACTKRCKREGEGRKGAALSYVFHPFFS
jgi:hypothetical protein